VLSSLCTEVHRLETTQIYLDANLAMKQAVPDKTTPPQGKPGRYRPDDRLRAVPQGLVVRPPMFREVHGWPLVAVCDTGHSPAREIVKFAVTR